MIKSEEINQILHQHIRLVFKDAINYKELIQALLDWNEKQLTIPDVVGQSEQLAAIFEKMNGQHITMLEIGDYDKLAKEMLSS